jgi:hypothetical protein
MRLYRERGRLDVSTDAGKRRAVMEIPLQLPRSGDGGGGSPGDV